MDLDLLEKIKKTAIQALVSDDSLMERLILKGGNALDLIYKMAQRASFDLDFSMEDSFDDTKLVELEDKIRKLLISAFQEIDYKGIDVSLAKKPSNISTALDSFWGGYKIELKLISIERLKEIKPDIASVRRNALPVGYGNSTKLRIEISRFEYCPLIEEKDVNGYLVKVYSPILIAAEKLRAICQQMDEYRDIVSTSTASPRARDFFDVYTILTACDIELRTSENRDLINAVFRAKKVPIHYLKNIRKYREFHAQDFVAVKDTIKVGTKLQGFDFYFDYVAAICDEL